MNLSELVCKGRGISPIQGDISGKCVFCGSLTEHGHKPQFSDSFTNANVGSGGDVLCPACHHMNTAEIPGAAQSAGKLYRANMWYATEHGVGVIRFPKKENAEHMPRDLSSVFSLPERTPRSILVEPPEPPFAIYLTESFKKTGWQTMLRCNGGVCLSRDRFFVGFDYSNVLVVRSLLQKFLAFIDDLRSKGITKRELYSGELRIRSLEQIECDANILNTIKKLSGDPLWYLSVYVS